MEIKDFKKLLNKLNEQKPEIKLKQLEHLLKKEDNKNVKKEIKKEINNAVKIVDDERSWKKQELEKVEVRRQDENTLDTTVNEEKSLEDVVETSTEKKDEIKEDIRLYASKATRIYLSQSGTAMQTIYTQANISRNIGDLRLEVSREAARVGVTFDPRWENSLNADTVNDSRWRAQREAINLIAGGELITDEKDKEIKKYKLKMQYER